ncbi:MULTISPECIES: 4'-phosphopantetheinyl transferase family protein [Caballeronia]|jgi:4'-phosphopantetheinyl transferase|uniref:4'-phosphopantetheinyl transferase family protein n=1 Tax=Caballeronia TaxID=1827195 RepID=UPI00158DE435|nr:MULTISPECIES: 4'-phosphopantetheinyl transferase superfamily protein [Caballeronia]MCG7402148.1 4'-phosphopantetheinyl transferase superfamily protein [Caballeronia zhejiangensis]MCI1042446.1 4'-phosphopantetheinyl transferase superfamily protein [Caballeronia zhejiangensis]
MTEATIPFDVRPMPLPDHAPGDVRAWLLHIDFSMPLDSAAYAVMNADERARAARFLRHADGARFGAVRCALRHLLAAETGDDPARLAFDAGDRGRPFLVHRNAPDFNVSHSGGYGLIAMSRERRVGADIEEARATFDWRDLAPAVLGDIDRREIEALPDDAARNRAFFDCWTAKEAVLKAHGDGIGSTDVAMHGFSVLPRRDVRYAVTRGAGAFDAISLTAPDGYAAALAWSY